MKIVAAHSSDKETFYKLIKTNKLQNSRSTTELFMNGKILTTPHEICNGWVVAKLQENEEFDANYKHKVEADLLLIKHLAASDDAAPPTISVEELHKAIQTINTKKTPMQMVSQ